MDQAKCGYDHDPKGSELLVRFGPQLKVDLGFDPDYVAALGKPHRPDIKGLDALIDTGASESYIDSSLARQFDFPTIDKEEAVTAGGRVLVTVHLAQMHVIALNVVLYGRLAAIDLENSGLGCQVLLGRSFLQDFQLTYDGRSGGVIIKHIE